MTKTKNEVRRLIKLKMIETGCESILELAGATGIDYQTLQRRIKAPEMFRVYEIRALCEALELADEDLIEILRGGGNN